MCRGALCVGLPAFMAVCLLAKSKMTRLIPFSYLSVEYKAAASRRRA